MYLLTWEISYKVIHSLDLQGKKRMAFQNVKSYKLNLLQSSMLTIKLYNAAIGFSYKL